MIAGTCYKDYQAKIIDFGFAMKAKFDQYSFIDCLGNLAHMAPELVHKRKYKNDIDVWALGCLAY